MKDRIIPFERVVNFRDFGGWETPDGAIARGRLWRSAAFHNASDADIAKLDALGVRFLVDLRLPSERDAEPNRWLGAARSITHDEPLGEMRAPHTSALEQSDYTAADVSRYMHAIYRTFPHEPRYVALYRSWFAELQQGGAGIIHCAAGKDRTGVGCALTLLALGAREDDAFADYEFTNQAANIEERLPGIHARMEERMGRKIDPAALKPMLGVETGYLRASLDVIEQKHGSVDAYLADVLGVDALARARLRENFLA